MLLKTVIGVVLLLSTAGQAAAGEPLSVSYELGIVTFPAGDPEAGRRQFVRYHCTACHLVPGEASLPEPVSAHRGPDLGRPQAGLEAGALMESIVAPSHWISPEIRFSSEGELSPMGDYTETMTVRELIDLVAFLKSLGTEPQHEPDARVLTEAP